jgi:hypothetical protein
MRLEGTNFCEAVDGMATTVERHRPSLTNEPTLRGRLGYQAGDARISMTARGPQRSLTSTRPDTFAPTFRPAQNHLAEPGRTIHSFGFLSLGCPGAAPSGSFASIDRDRSKSSGRRIPP